LKNYISFIILNIYPRAFFRNFWPDLNPAKVNFFALFWNFLADFWGIFGGFLADFWQIFGGFLALFKPG
jgi:hypothetical protein